MFSLPKALQLDLMKLVPLSFINDISCFVMYDHHPRDNKNQIDVTFCTKSGEMREVFKKETVSLLLLRVVNPSEILILRNSKCQLFYLVAADDELIIVSKKNNDLEIHKRLSNVESYEINDAGLIGQACLKIICKDDAVPLIFDDEFESLGDQAAILCGLSSDDSLPVLTHLKTKLTEVKYNVKCNEKTLKSFQELQHTAAFETYQKIHPSLKEDIFKGGYLQMANSLKIRMETPWIKVCNKHLVMVVNVVNNCIETLENIHILIHGNSLPAMSYTSKVYQRDLSPPYWKESPTKSIEPSIESAIIAVITLKELKQCLGNIQLTGLISYKKSDKEQLLPLETVRLSTMDILGDELHVLSSVSDDPNAFLTVLATTTKTNMLLHHIRSPNESNLIVSDVFTKYLKMEKIDDRIFIYKSSPYHIMNGVMVVLSDSGRTQDWIYPVILYTRSHSQILPFMNLIYEAVPLKIVATPDNIHVTFTNPDLSAFNEGNTFENSENEKGRGYATSLLNKSSKILEYLDFCLLNMNNSKDPVTQSKIGSEIDLLAGGSPAFLKFRNYLLDIPSDGSQVQKK